MFLACECNFLRSVCLSDSNTDKPGCFNLQHSTWSSRCNYGASESRPSQISEEVHWSIVVETIPNEGSRALITCKHVGACSRLYRRQIEKKGRLFPRHLSRDTRTIIPMRNCRYSYCRYFILFFITIWMSGFSQISAGLTTHNALS